MDDITKYILLRTVQDNNILPITSYCNMACRFCSHLGNPPGLKVYSLGHLDRGLIEELIDFLPADGPVIIGESATRVIEGDPFTHPDLNHILCSLRQKYPEKPIRLTTEGSCLSGNKIKLLTRLRPVELNISLNCSNPEERVFLMRDQDPEQVFRGIELLAEEGIPFNGSIVAMPHLLGPESIERTVDYLARYAPGTVRILIPGFTRYSPDEIKYNLEGLFQELSGLIKGLDRKYPFPLLLEPPLLKDLTCSIRGILPDTPAAELSLQKNDIINKINGKSVLSRVDAFDRLVKACNPRLEISRDGEQREYLLKKEKGERPGIVLDYDLDPIMIEQLTSFLSVNQAGRIALVTSRLAEDLMKMVLNRLQGLFPDKEIELAPVKNHFFGGSIMSAGLLTNHDIYRHFAQRKSKLDLLLLPGIIYDIFGNDLTGESYTRLEQKLRIRVEKI